MAAYTSASSSPTKKRNSLDQREEQHPYNKASPACRGGFILLLLLLNQAIQDKHPVSQDGSDEAPYGMCKDCL